MISAVSVSLFFYQAIFCEQNVRMADQHLFFKRKSLTFHEFNIVQKSFLNMHKTFNTFEFPTIHKQTKNK